MNILFLEARLILSHHGQVAKKIASFYFFHRYNARLAAAGKFPCGILFIVF
jgi:hypothetical protein